MPAKLHHDSEPLGLSHVKRFLTWRFWRFSWVQEMGTYPKTVAVCLACPPDPRAHSYGSGYLTGFLAPAETELVLGQVWRDGDRNALWQRGQP